MQQLNLFLCFAELDTQKRSETTSDNAESTSTGEKCHFIRTTPNKDKCDQKQGSRDSGFSERSYCSSSGESCADDDNSFEEKNISTVFQHVEQEQLPKLDSTTSKLFIQKSCGKSSQQTEQQPERELQQQPQKQQSELKSLETPSPETQQSSHQQLQQLECLHPVQFGDFYQVHYNLRCDKRVHQEVDSDSESVLSSRTLTNSQSTTRSIPDGLNVTEGHKSSRAARNSQFAHQDSMFRARERSSLYFPINRMKGNIIKTKRLR